MRVGEREAEREIKALHEAAVSVGARGIRLIHLQPAWGPKSTKPMANRGKAERGCGVQPGTQQQRVVLVAPAWRSKQTVGAWKVVAVVVKRNGVVCTILHMLLLLLFLLEVTLLVLVVLVLVLLLVVVVAQITTPCHICCGSTRR